MDNEFSSTGEETGDRVAVQVLCQRLSDLTSKNRQLELDEPMLAPHLNQFCAQTGQVLSQLRSNGQLCDAVLRTQDGTEFLIHRVILSGEPQLTRFQVNQVPSFSLAGQPTAASSRLCSRTASTTPTSRSSTSEASSRRR